MTKTILAIFAHPDDETVMSGSLLQAMAGGWRVELVSSTLGEAGELNDPSLGTLDELPEIRERELRCTCDNLGIASLHLLGYCDSGMEGTPVNSQASSFINAAPEAVVGQLVALMRRIQPDVVVTFEPWGIYGHPDHIAVSKHATAAFLAVGTDDWQPKKLFHAGIPAARFEILSQVMEASGVADREDRGRFPVKEDFDQVVTHALDISAFYDQKVDAAYCHKSQIKPQSFFDYMKNPALHSFYNQEYLAQVYPEWDGVSGWLD